MRSSFLFSIPILISALVLIGAADYYYSEISDADGDGMSDVYEIFFGLDPTNPDDVFQDPDGDRLSNLREASLLTDPFAPDTDRDGFNDDADANPISRAYIQWGTPLFTHGDFYEYAHPDWFLSAYKVGGQWVVDAATTQSAWRVSGAELEEHCSLNIDLDRSILTNNLRYAFHYALSAHSATVNVSSNRVDVVPALFVDLLDTNGLVVVENLYDKLLSGRNAEANVVLDIPMSKYPDAAVIHLRCEQNELCEGTLLVSEALLYIDEDGDGLDADQERQIGTSDYAVDSNGNGTNDYDECFHQNDSSTNNPPSSLPDPRPPPDKSRIIYVDQSIGNDAFTGRSSVILESDQGPKKTVHAGLSITEADDLLVIRSGFYKENLNISGKNVKVVIEGKVRL